MQGPGTEAQRRNYRFGVKVHPYEKKEKYLELLHFKRGWDYSFHFLVKFHSFPESIMPQLEKFITPEHLFSLLFASLCMVFLFIFGHLVYLFQLLYLYSKILREVLQFNRQFGEPICFKFSWKEGVSIRVQKGERGKPVEAKEADQTMVQKNQIDMSL